MTESITLDITCVEMVYLHGSEFQNFRYKNCPKYMQLRCIQII